jgi:hypothetical protein
MIIELDDQSAENVVRVLHKAVQDADITTARVLIPLHDSIVEQAKEQQIQALRASDVTPPDESA